MVKRTLAYLFGVVALLSARDSSRANITGLDSKVDDQPLNVPAQVIEAEPVAQGYQSVRGAQPVEAFKRAVYDLPLESIHENAKPEIVSHFSLTLIVPQSIFRNELD